MKLVWTLSLFLFFCFFLPEISAQEISYPIEFPPMAIRGVPVNLKAEIIEPDHFKITLILQSDESRKTEETVWPFDLNNFKEKVKAGLTKLLNPDQTEETPDDPLKPSSLGNFDHRSLDELFYQLKGAGLLTKENAQALKPKAGDLCFKPIPLVLKLNTSLIYQSALLKKREKEAEVENEISRLQSNGKSFTKKEKRKLKRELNTVYEARKKFEQKDSIKVLSKLFQETRQEYKIATDSLRYLRNLKRARESSLKLYSNRDEIIQNHKRQIEDWRQWLNEELTSLSQIDLDLAKTVWAETEKENITLAKTNLQDLQRRVALEETPQGQSADILIQKKEMLNSIVQLYYEYTDLKIRDIPAEITSGTYQLLALDLQKSIRQIDTAINRIEPRVEKLKNEASIIQSKLDVSGSYRPFEVDYVDIEFNEGFIEQIVVVGYVDPSPTTFALEQASGTPAMASPKQKLVFTNYWPLGFSRKQDFNQLRSIRLTGSAEDYENDKYELFLGDLILNYIPKPAVGRRDFSPENLDVKYDPKKDDDCIVLYKEDTYKLFEARVFSDLVGIDADKPNGLVQTEIAKRINLNTRRYTGRHANINAVNNLGIFSWFEPKITLSKVENNNRYLILNQVDPGHPSRRLISTLDVREREAFSIGTSGNLLYLDFPYFKCNFALNGGFRYGRTPVQIDTNRTGINTLSVYPELALDVRGDERWGASLALQLNRMRIFGRHVKQVASVEDPGNIIASNINDGKWFGTSQIFIFFHPSVESDGRLFIRYRYNWQLGDTDLGFHQAQLGYSFYLLGRNNKVKK